MKKILISLVVCCITVAVNAQTKYVDSSKILLAAAVKPIERFDLLNKIIDYNDGRHGNLQDTAIGLQMHRLAQQLQNDSLLAISTNVVGNYFRGKGDLPVALDYFFKAIRGIHSSREL